MFIDKINMILWLENFLMIRYTRSNVSVTKMLM